ncbi:uncharacterized protein ISCGN_015052 [Ixodes scapularis]
MQCCKYLPDKKVALTLHLLENANIISIRTDSEEVARHIQEIKTIQAEDLKELPVQVFRTYGNTYVKGVIYDLFSLTQDRDDHTLNNELESNKIQIVAARRLGKTNTAIITFDGDHLPRSILYGNIYKRVFPYKPKAVVCANCHCLGHKEDICPNSGDVLLQIKEDILDRISCTTTRAVLALDIKGAFDNVSHTLVFENLASTGCGPWMYDYVRDFLSNWMATIGIESIRTSTIPIPSKGNRQGSVLSPTFGRQDFLEEVIETVQNYLEAGNLQRAPDKSQLLLLRAGKPIPEEEEGGHPPHRDGGPKYTVDRLVKTTTQVMRMVRRITSHRHGLEESDLIRLTQPLVVSHIACANPYLNLLSRGKGKMDVIIRKGY